jgi:hypothetical protein
MAKQKGNWTPVFRRIDEILRRGQKINCNQADVHINCRRFRCSSRSSDFLLLRHLAAQFLIAKKLSCKKRKENMYFLLSLFFFFVDTDASLQI